MQKLAVGLLGGVLSLGLLPVQYAKAQALGPYDPIGTWNITANFTGGGIYQGVLTVCPTNSYHTAGYGGFDNTPMDWIRPTLPTIRMNVGTGDRAVYSGNVLNGQMSGTIAKQSTPQQKIGSFTASRTSTQNPCSN